MQSHEQISNLLTILSKPNRKEPGLKIKTVLEIGCGRGYLTEGLREQGFRAEGIDIAPRTKSRYLHKADASKLKDHFKNRKFDAIVASGVLCIGGLLQGLSIANPEKERALWRKKDKDLADFCRNAALSILKSCYGQLNSPGLFIDIERNTYLDRLAYARKDATAIGYRPFVFKRDAAVLIKDN